MPDVVPPRFQPGPLIQPGPLVNALGPTRSDFMTVAHDPPPAWWRRTWVVLSIAGVLIVGSTVYAAARTARSGTTGPLTAGAIIGGVPRPGSTGAATTSTTPGALDPVTLAQEVGLQPGDLAQGWTEIPGTAAVMSSPTAPGPCAPVSGGPWLADVSSADYQSPNGWTAFSQVVVMPDATDATAALHAIEAPGYAAGCFQPTWDQWAKQAITSANAQAPCDLSFTGSTVGPVPAPSVPTGVPGAAGVEYQARISCPSEGPSTITRDEISTVVKNLFVQVQFFGGGTSPTLAESSSLSDIASRASTATSNP